MSGTTYDVWNYQAEFKEGSSDTFYVHFARYLGYIPKPGHNFSVDANNSDNQFGIATHVHTLTCNGYAAAFSVDIINRDGSQDVTYDIAGNSALNASDPSFTWTADNSDWADDDERDAEKYLPEYISSIVPRQSDEYKKWASQEIPEYLRTLNALHLFEYALGSIAGYLGTWIEINVTQGVQCIKDDWWEGDGVQRHRVDLCPLKDKDVWGDARYMGISDMPECKWPLLYFHYR